MNALSIDCSVSKIAVAAKKDEQLVKLTLDVGTKQSEKLLPAIDYVMKELSLEPSDLDYTVCTKGPGSFTGLRLGMSALKALNLSFGIPLYAVPSLDAYAHAFGKTFETLLSLIQSKEDEYFYAFYSHGKKLREEGDATTEEILTQIKKDSFVTLCGPGSDAFLSGLKENASYSLHQISPQNDGCESLFKIAEEMIKANESPLADYDGPLYVRKSEAEIVLEKKSASKQSIKE